MKDLSNQNCCFATVVPNQYTRNWASYPCCFIVGHILVLYYVVEVPGLNALYGFCLMKEKSSALLHTVGSIIKTVKFSLAFLDS